MKKTENFLTKEEEIWIEEHCSPSEFEEAQAWFLAHKGELSGFEPLVDSEGR